MSNDLSSEIVQYKYSQPEMGEKTLTLSILSYYGTPLFPHTFSYNL